MRRPLEVAVLAAVALLIGLRLDAQETTTGSIADRVLDFLGAAVPGAPSTAPSP